jgi:uncharacterized protein YoxC
MAIIAVAFLLFVYGTSRALDIVSKTHVGTKKGTYKSYVTTSEKIQTQANTLTQSCQSKLCEVQTLLDFATGIPYKSSTFQQKSPQKTIQENFGDCDDKSNLLISMLHALDIEAYFVLVPKHIFVIVALDDERLSHKKALWINDKKYYILESTADKSKVGFALKYKLSQINVIIEPFSNKKIQINKLEYK